MIADAAWPDFDPALLIDDEVTIAVQVNGKLRETMTAPRGLRREEAEALALALPKVQSQLGGGDPAQGDCGSRPAGQYRRMIRVALPWPCCWSSAACGLAADVCGRLIGRGGDGSARRSRSRRFPDRAGWLVRNALVDRLGGEATAIRPIGWRSSSTTISPASAFAATAR